MADTTTTTYGLTKIEVGASEDTWGAKLNTNFDSLDDLLDGTTVLTGLSLDDTATLVDNLDNTKVAQFQASGITTGTTRTFTFPDASGTIALTDATLTSISALGSAGDKGLYFTGVDTAAEFDLTAAGRALLDDADASVQRTTLGLGGLATLDILDEDDFATDSAARPPSQQSTKAFIDGAIDGVTVGPTSASPATSVDFTSIPSGVSYIEVVMENLSLSGTDSIQVQLSTSSTFVTTGYNAFNYTFTGSGQATSTGTTAFVVGMASAARAADGILVLARVGGTNRWAANGSHKRASGEGSLTGGIIDLAGALDGVRVRSSGSDTFDSGSVSIRYIGG